MVEYLGNVYNVKNIWHVTSSWRVSIFDHFQKWVTTIFRWYTVSCYQSDDMIVQHLWNVLSVKNIWHVTSSWRHQSMKKGQFLHICKFLSPIHVCFIWSHGLPWKLIYFKPRACRWCNCVNKAIISYILVCLFCFRKLITSRYRTYPQLSNIH